jgi:hypothetical protein
MTFGGVMPAAEGLAMTSLSSPLAPKRFASLMTAINVLVAGGFSIAGLVSPKSIAPAGYAPTETSFIFAMYAAARSIPLAFMALIAIYQQSEAGLLILGTLAGFVHLLDAGVGFLQHDLGKAIEPLVDILSGSSAMVLMISTIVFSIILLAMYHVVAASWSSAIDFPCAIRSATAEYRCGKRFRTRLFQSGFRGGVMEASL